MSHGPPTSQAAPVPEPAHAPARRVAAMAITVVAIVATATVAVVRPTAALEPAPAPEVVPTERDRPVPADADGDGLAVARAQVALDRSVDVSGVEALHHPAEESGTDAGHHGLAVDHDHTGGDRVPGARIALATSPELVIIDDLEPGTHLGLRTRTGSTWDDWMEVVSDEAEAPDGRPGEEGHGSGSGVGPVWLGNGVHEIEIAVLQGHVDTLALTQLHLVDPRDDAGHQSTGRARFAASSAELPALVRPRSSWATSDMGWACDTGPTTSNEMKAVVVHHTAGRNDYTRDQVPGILRAIWYYHVQTRGWCDIAYNLLVDRYGGIWEGRQGGIDKAIIGGHTYGYNTNTSGVAQLGDYQAAQAPAAMTEATATIVGWKLALHGVEPSGTTTLTNRSNREVNGVPAGGETTVPKIIGHRDLGQTSCPGINTYNLLQSVRAGAPLGAHVYALFETFLRRPPAPEHYAHWLDAAEADGIRATALAMARSEEYAGLIVTDLYNRVLDRNPDGAGMAYWLGVLAEGTRVEEVGVYFYGSDEFYESAGSPEEYVRALYQNLLHRDPDDAGLKYWSGKLRTGTAPPDVARGFYLSLESRRDRVARLYDDILGRGPDSAGHSYWADQLITTDDIFLAVDLTMSDEYYERATTR